jgi:hypothetical protein
LNISYKGNKDVALAAQTKVRLSGNTIGFNLWRLKSFDDKFVAIHKQCDKYHSFLKCIKNELNSFFCHDFGNFLSLTVRITPTVTGRMVRHVRLRF